MPWQDFVIGLGSILFILALIPTLLSDDKPRYETAIITSAVLFGFSGTYITLDLVFAAITSAITASLWLKIAADAFVQQEEEEDWYE
jgi:hypothetical protein